MTTGNAVLNFIIVCDNAFIAQGTNSLSIISIFDRISAQKFPAIHPRMVVVTNITGDIGVYNQVVTLKNKLSGVKIAELQVPVDINTIGQKAQFIGSFFNLVFPAAGEYVFEVIINNQIQNLSANIYVG